MVDDLAEFAFVDDDDDSPLTTDQDLRGRDGGGGATRPRVLLAVYGVTVRTIVRLAVVSSSSPSLRFTPVQAGSRRALCRSPALACSCVHMRLSDESRRWRALVMPIHAIAATDTWRTTRRFTQTNLKIATTCAYSLGVRDRRDGL